MTQEIRLPHIDFKEIRIESLCKTDIDISTLSIDRVASTVLINEQDSILAKIVGLESDCSYTPIDGNGCYISLLEYAPNIPPFSIGDLIQAFTYGVQYGTKECDDTLVYKYNYLWFDVEDVSRSILTRFFGDRLEEVFSDEHIHVNRMRFFDSV